MKPVQRVKSWNKGSKDQEENQSSYISPSRYKMSPYLTIYFTRTETISDEGSSTATVTVTATTTSTASIATDPYYLSVSLLLHMNGTNGSTTFIDSSPSPKTVTANGSAAMSTAVSKFGGASGAFDGSSDYLSIPTSSDFAFGTGDFTIEMWLYRTAANQQHLYEGRNGTTVNTILLYLDNAPAYLAYYANGAQRISTTSTPALNTWVHIAVARSGNSTKLFMDGVQVGSTYTDSLTYAAPTTSLYIGTNDVASGSFVNGYIDDLRVTKGIARYTSNFTVPAIEHPDVAESDTYFSSVSLLMPMNGVNGSTTFTDYSSLSNSITVNGNSSISTTKYKWGGSSGLFDGTTDWLYAPVGSVNFGTGDFTVEGWFNWASLTNGGLFQVYPGTPPNTTGGVAVGYDGVDFQIYSGNANYSRNYTPTTNTWYHVALVRNSSSLTLYVNGVAQGASLTDTTNYGGNGINVGLYYGSGYTFNGNINDFRVTTGVARYTANFTPPTASFPLS